MKKTILTALAFAVLFAAAASAQKTFTVSTMDQFLRAIGPDRIIVMKPGTYAVKKSNSVKNQYFRWEDMGGEDFKLVLQNINNLTIKAQSSDVGMIATTPYAPVLSFVSCFSIVLEGLTMGHEASEPCMAGVLSLNDTDDVTIESCDLYGSGANGVEAYGGEGIKLSNTTIRDCSYNAALFTASSAVYFENCIITANDIYGPLFYLDNVDGIWFADCEISYNIGETLLSARGDGMSGVEFTGCTFDSNGIAAFCEFGTEVAFTGCTFASNDFGDDPEGFGGTGDGIGGYDEDVSMPYEYTFLPAGLTFFIMPDWEPMESPDGQSLKIAPWSEESGVIVSALYTVPAGGSVEKNKKRYLDEGLKGFLNIMKQQGATASMTLQGDVFDVEGLPAADYRGSGKINKTQDVQYLVRLVISRGSVWGIMGIADQVEPIAEDSDMAYLIESVGLAPEGE